MFSRLFWLVLERRVRFVGPKQVGTSCPGPSSNQYAGRSRAGQSCSSDVMNSWLFRSLVALYPKAWRERYSKEVGEAVVISPRRRTRPHGADRRCHDARCAQAWRHRGSGHDVDTRRQPEYGFVVNAVFLTTS